MVHFRLFVLREMDETPRSGVWGTPCGGVGCGRGVIGVMLLLFSKVFLCCKIFDFFLTSPKCSVEKMFPSLASKTSCDTRRARF